MDYEISHVHYVVLGQRYGIRRQESSYLRSYLFACVVVLSPTKNDIEASRAAYKYLSRVLRRFCLKRLSARRDLGKVWH